MGSGVSMERDALKPLLLSQELLDGSSSMARDKLFRISFTNYIKGGAWMDHLSQLVPDFRPAPNGIVEEEGDDIAYLHQYDIDHDRLMALRSSSYGDKSPKPSFGVPGVPSLRSSSQSTVIDRHGELYAGETNSFSHEELLVILFTILYPIYLSSKDHERFLKHGIEQGKGATDDNSSRSMAHMNHQGTHMIQTDQSKRAQDLLLNCAAYYDESFLQEYLQEPTWLQRVCAIFHDHPLALCIADTTKVGLPILFANKAFCSMFGYTELELIGSNMSILNGSCTEVSQIKLMHSSIHSTETVKFSITLQSKSKRTVFDLVAQKAVGSYSVSAHFVKSRSTPLDALNMVDDVLILLSYLVKAPALPAKPSWLPAPIVILARTATSAFSPSPSPSSARSHSSSVSRGRSRTHSSGFTGQGHSKNGKSTPSSVRSFDSGGLFGGVTSAPTTTMSTSSDDGAAQNSFRSFRVGGPRRHSRGGDASTPTSARRAMQAVQHVSADVEDAVEFSVGEVTGANSHRK